MTRYDDANVGEQLMMDPRFLAIEARGVRLLYLEALVWARAHRTDGAIAKHMLRRITDESDADAAAVQLVAAELWETTDSGWQIVDYAGTQLSRSVVEREQSAARDRWERYREKRNGNAAANGAANGTATPLATDHKNVSERERKRTERTYVRQGATDAAAPVRARGSARQGTGLTEATLGALGDPCVVCGKLIKGGSRAYAAAGGRFLHPRCAPSQLAVAQ